MNDIYVVNIKMNTSHQPSMSVYDKYFKIPYTETENILSMYNDDIIDN